MAIASICQDPRPGFQNIMYLCTGESFGNADAVRGVGAFKSVDQFAEVKGIGEKTLETNRKSIRI